MRTEAGGGGGSRGYTLANGGLITLVQIRSMANGRWVWGGGERGGETSKLKREMIRMIRGFSDESRVTVRRGK